MLIYWFISLFEQKSFLKLKIIVFKKNFLEKFANKIFCLVSYEYSAWHCVLFTYVYNDLLYQFQSPEPY